MKLGPWLTENNLKPAQFAPRIGCTGEAVRRYVAGERIPDKATMPRIAKETAGQVTANDFFGIEFATSSAEADGQGLASSSPDAVSASARVAA